MCVYFVPKVKKYPYFGVFCVAIYLLLSCGFSILWYPEARDPEMVQLCADSLLPTHLYQVFSALDWFGCVGGKFGQGIDVGINVNCPRVLEKLWFDLAGF